MRELRLPREAAEEIADELWYRHIDDTVVAVAQDVDSEEVLMVAHMNREAVILTLTTGMVHYWSTTRKRIWRKGEESGNYQKVVDFRVDCDKDAVLVRVKQGGHACHLGTRSCFDLKNQPSALRGRTQ